MEEEHGEERRCQNFHLVGDGVDSGVQIRNGNETSDLRKRTSPYRRLF